MIGRTLRIALLVSLGVHVIGMSAVTIIAPGGPERAKTYTRVDFLGPILKKTAFDIMLENVNPVVKTTYRHMMASPGSGQLEIAVPKQETVIREFPEYLENNMDALISDFLKGTKTVPEFYAGFETDELLMNNWAPLARDKENERKVIYKPGQPFIMRGFYGDRESFRVKMKVLINSDGNVKAVEMLVTTGYPNLDITASKHVKGWIFEPSESRDPEWRKVDVILNTGE
ncbi:MAG: energy transducer TonB [Candidatus Omnitrophica bacterium]|nr:energy transducer TonB [Candidatus Omnitrophota bacterium]